MGASRCTTQEQRRANTMRSPRSDRRSRWIRGRLHPSEQKYITRDPEQQKCSRGYERSRERMSRLDDVAGKNRSRDGRKLITKVDDSAERANTFSWSDQRGNRPANWRRGCQSAQRQAYPKQRGQGRASSCGAKYSKPQNRSSNEYSLANTNWIPASLNERVNQP